MSLPNFNTRGLRASRNPRFGSGVNEFLPDEPPVDLFGELNQGVGHFHRI